MKKIFALLLVFLMIISTIPSVYADDDLGCGNEDAQCPNCGEWSYCYDDAVCHSCGYPHTTTTTPEVGKTTITLVGTADTYYEVQVPAAMTPGETATISITGAWDSAHTLKVSAPSSVTLYYGDQSMDIGIQFSGISQIGDDVEESTASASLTIENKTVRFGTWVGVIEYDVELVESSGGAD